MSAPPGVPAYERDARLSALDTTVVATGDDGGKPWVALEDTVFYPEGGGQPADRGALVIEPGAGGGGGTGPGFGVADVVDVRRVDGVVRHYLAPPAAELAPGTRVRAQIDVVRRLDHAQQHTAQHLLTAIAQDRFGWPTTAFHLGPYDGGVDEVSDIELDVPSLPADQLAALEDACAAAIRAARPVTARRVSAEAMASLPVRTRGLPEGHAGEVRLVEIAGIDLNTCGGTHLATTAEIEVLKLLDTEPMRGGTRLHFVAGARARRRMQAHEERTAALRRVLGATDAELVDAAEAKLEQLKDTLRRLRATEEDLAAAAATALAAGLGPGGERIVTADWPERDGGFLQRVARGLRECAPQAIALLTAGGVFALVAGDASGLDLPTVGPRVAQALGGRGGGAAGVYQGKFTPAASAEARDAAREAALAILREASDVAP